MQSISTAQHIRSEIDEQGYSVVRAKQLKLSEEMQAEWEALLEDYQSLPRDNYLPDKGLYRFRRYDRFYYLPSTSEVHLLPHEDYFQATDINQVTGGMVRQFEPMLKNSTQNTFLHDLIRFDFAQFPLANSEMAQDTWQVDVHQVLVTADVGSRGEPTPEGIHRDGAAFVTVHLAVLENAVGGEASVYDDDKNHLASFQLETVLDSYLFNDAILWHGVTPIRSADGEHPAKRGILTFDYHHRPDLEKPV